MREERDTWRQQGSPTPGKGRWSGQSGQKGLQLGAGFGRAGEGAGTLALPRSRVLKSEGGAQSGALHGAGDPSGVFSQSHTIS